MTKQILCSRGGCGLPAATIVVGIKTLKVAWLCDPHSAGGAHRQSDFAVGPVPVWLRRQVMAKDLTFDR
jgi:hypothetical protein